MTKRAGFMTFIPGMLLLLGLAVLSLLLPRQSYSLSENRPLAEKPALTWATLRTGAYTAAWDSYVNDHVAGRDGLMAVQALVDTALLRTERNDVLLGKDGHLMDKVDELSLGATESNLRAVEKLSRATGLPVVTALIPAKWQVYPELLPAFYPTSPVGEELRQALGDSVSPVTDLTQALIAQKHRGLLYYRTDHHLTALGAETVYGALADKLGLSASPVPAPISYRGFLGSYASRAPSPLLAPDTLTVSPVTGLTLSVDGQEKPGLVDDSLLARPNSYAALLYNNPGLLTLDNPAGSGVLLVIRDSNANSFLPLLARHYRRVIAIDPRSYSGDLVTLCEQEKVENILCVYGFTALTKDRNLPRLTALLP